MLRRSLRGGVPSLEDRARKEFGRLRDAERRALDAIRTGREERFADDVPTDAPEHEAIRAPFLRWLLVQAGSTAGGLRLRGVRIVGELQLDGLKLDFPVLLRNCALARVSLVDTGLATLSLDGSRCTWIQADRMKVARGLLLREGFRCDGLVFLADAEIGGDVNCDGGWFCRPGSRALILDGARVGGRLFLRNGRYSGAVHAVNARVDGGVNAVRAYFHHPDDVALKLERLRAGGFISLERAVVRGSLLMAGASTGSDLILERLKVREVPDDVGIDLDRCTVGGRLVLTRARCRGALQLRNAAIGKTLEASGARVGAGGPTALTAAGASIGGRVVLRDGFRAKGTVTFTGSTIEGDLSMLGEDSITAGDRPGLQLNRTEIRGDVELTGRITGRPALNLTSTSIGGELLLRKGRFETSGSPPEGYKRPVSIRGEGLSVTGSLLAAEMAAIKGEVRLPRSTIGGDVEFDRASLPAGLVLGAIRARARLLLDEAELGRFSMVSGAIGGRFRWNPKDLADNTQVMLRHSTVGYLDDTGAKWPKEGLQLDGFAYGGIARVGSVSSRLAWIRSQTGAKGRYSPLPYEQLVLALRRDGHESEARQVAREKQSDLREYGKLKPGAWIWNLIVGTFLGHGYQLWRALFVAAAFVVFGSFAFDLNDMFDAKTGTDRPSFQPIAYSFDAFVPVINLHQEEYRLPDPGRWQEVYLWFHIAAGWAMTTLLALGLTSLVRKD